MGGGSDALSGDQHLVRTIRATSRAIAAALIVLGAAVLGGWLFRSPTLISLSPRFAPMKPNTALGFIATGS
ncbi:MAG TPA: hypothetical protein VHM25_14675, partial [Polyangiaceae bacterium]|nr:hypothetical protein [Polyangiaceae bacterium]